MILKKKNTNRLALPSGFKVFREKKFFFGALFLLLYSVTLLALGYVLKRHDFYGLVFKPVVVANYRMIGNLINSYSVDPEKISIDIKHMDYLKLAFKRQQGLDFGALPYSPDKDWVPATLKHRGKTMKADIRLKGIGEEHWKDKDIWSYKVKIKKNNTLFGMKRFALEAPKTRTFLNEWHWHKLLRYSGLIYMRFDFIDLTINGKNLPIYAIEENFEKRLIENNKLRDGPIFWAGIDALTTIKAIEVYQAEKRSEDPKFMKLISLAESRVEAFRQGELTFSKVFDVDKMSKLYALADLVGSRHSLDLGNLKFYLNPITGLIEPIASDSSIIMSRRAKINFIGEGRRYLGKNNENEYWQWPLVPFQDKIFFKKYIESLEEISDKNFLDKFFSIIEEEEQKKMKVLHRSFPYYKSYFKETIYENSEYIKKHLQPQKVLNVYFNKASKKSGIISLDIANIHTFPVEILGIAFIKNPVPKSKETRNAIRGDREDGYRIMAAEVKLKGYKDKLATGIIKPLNETIVQGKRMKTIFHDVDAPLAELSSIKKQLLTEVKGMTDLIPMVSKPLENKNINQQSQRKNISGLEYKHIRFRLPDELEWSDELLKNLKVVTRVFGARLKNLNDVTSWSRHEEWFNMPENIREVPFMIVEEEKKVINIIQGNWIVNQDIIVPPGYRLVVAEGTRLELINNAKIVSYSALDFNGSKGKPIVIVSKNESGQGIVVMRSKDKSIIKHTIFNGLSSPSQGGWALPGGVTFYESDVFVSDAQFINSRSEDALNIVRSEFVLENTVFRNALADAFDSDFSNGVIKNIYFFNCGNDGLDVSGSEIQIESIFFNGIGDKGVSAGEKSRVFVDKLIGQNSKISVASKDQSSVFIKEAKLNKSKIGFAVFQKKPEFGPAKIKVDKLDMFNLGTLSIVEEGSSLDINGAPVLPRSKDVAKLLYGLNFDGLANLKE
jgi:hypothetical protein